MTETCDVVVVGGGPAGLTAAAAAAKAGAETIVFERQNEIGYPIHTSGASWVDAMESFDIPQHLYHQVSRLVFIGPSTEFEIHKAGVGCILDIRGLYQHLATRAVAAGATIRLRHRVDTPQLENGRVVGVSYKDHTGARRELRAPMTIDASGYSRTISRKSGLAPEFHRYGFGAEYDLYAPNYPADSVYLIVGSELAPHGYAWLCARGEGRVRVGVGIIHPDCKDDPRDYLDKVMKLPQVVKLLKDASPIEYHTGLFPSEPHSPSFSQPGLLLAGDTGAQGSTFVGEGIRFAMYSGDMAGDMAARAVASNDFSAEFLRTYDKDWQERFGRDIRLSYFFNERIAQFTDERWDKALKVLEKLSADQVAQLIKAEFSPKFFLGLAAKMPGILASGSRSLFKEAMQRAKA